MEGEGEGRGRQSASVTSGDPISRSVASADLARVYLDATLLAHMTWHTGGGEAVTSYSAARLYNS